MDFLHTIIYFTNYNLSLCTHLYKFLSLLFTRTISHTPTLLCIETSPTLVFKLARNTILSFGLKLSRQSVGSSQSLFFTLFTFHHLGHPFLPSNHPFHSHQPRTNLLLSITQLINSSFSKHCYSYIALAHSPTTYSRLPLSFLSHMARLISIMQSSVSFSLRS